MSTAAAALPTAWVVFANHFDLIWRRGWERAYEDDGQRFASYSEVETAILDAGLALAEAGRGAYQVEQALTVRMYLRRRPDALPRLRRLYQQGLFEVFGAGEAIIDVNMCQCETMIRNLAAGSRFCRDVLGHHPTLATHCDGFGSSAQFPQVIRGCGYRGVTGLSYAVPDKEFWRGLDGSAVYVWKAWPGKSLFYDHCYHEPCPVCRGQGAAVQCAACQGTGFDLPQNFYPPFVPLTAGEFSQGLAQYAVTSEEMLPPPYMDDLLQTWRAQQPEFRYQWGTQRHLAPLLAEGLALADAPPAERLSSQVDNNPTQTGCLVSRARVKQGAARSEALYYATEAAVAAALFAGPPTADAVAAWHELFLELPLYYFHDAVTGTHQDPAAQELLARMAAHEAQVQALGTALVTGRSQQAATLTTAPCSVVRAFNPRAEKGAALRLPLPVADWRQMGPLVAETADGKQFPVTLPWHAHSPVVPLGQGRLINAVGSGTRARPVTGEAFIEARDLPPLAWTEFTLRAAPAPAPLTARELRNERFVVQLGEQGIAAITDRRSGAVVHATPEQPLGSLRLDEDEGDPWNTRKAVAFRRSLAPYTRLLGAAAFAGYSEAWYGGVYEPNLPFGREQDPQIFALEWFLTVRLLDGAERLDFHYEIFWKSANRRVRALFPVQPDSDTGWYSLPGGWLERPRYEPTSTALWAPNGDWPANDFVAAHGPSPGAPGWAVSHHGSPAARIADGAIEISLLRSPAFGHCLERYAQRYPMPTSGIRDPGWHHFTLSLWPHAGPADLPRLARQVAAAKVRPLVLAPLPGDPLVAAAWPALSSDTVTLLASKPVFLPPPAGVPANAVALRLLNQSATATTATLTAPPGGTLCWQEGDLLEQPLGPVATLAPGATLTLPFDPFKLRTLLVWRAT